MLCERLYYWCDTFFHVSLYLSHTFPMLSILKICSLFLRPRRKRGISCCKDTEDVGSLQKSVVAHGSLTLPLFILKFSPKSRKCSKLNIFHSEPLLLEDGWFHESGHLSINKNWSIMISMVGSVLKEYVFLSSDCTWAQTHIHFQSLSSCHFNPLLSWNSLGFKEQKLYRVPDNMIMNMIKNN